MAQILNLKLMRGDAVLANIQNFSISSASPSMSGIELNFELEVVATERGTEVDLAIQEFEIGLHVFAENGAKLYLGRLRNNLSEALKFTYPRTIQRKLEISFDAFWKLVDMTHYRNLELNFAARASGTMERQYVKEAIVLEGNERGIFPHSEWVSVLNQSKFDRIEVVTLRVASPSVGKVKEKYDDAFGLLGDAKECFNRGDWNSTGA